MPKPDKSLTPAMKTGLLGKNSPSRHGAGRRVKGAIVWSSERVTRAMRKKGLVDKAVEDDEGPVRLTEKGANAAKYLLDLEQLEKDLKGSGLRKKEVAPGKFDLIDADGEVKLRRKSPGDAARWVFTRKVREKRKRQKARGQANKPMTKERKKQLEAELSRFRNGR